MYHAPTMLMAIGSAARRRANPTYDRRHLSDAVIPGDKRESNN